MGNDTESHPDLKRRIASLRQLPTQPVAQGAALLFVGLWLMVPLGYLGKDIAPPWCFGAGFPLAWIGFAWLSKGRGPIYSIGGGLLVAGVVGFCATLLGAMLTGHFLRDTLCASPLLYAACHLRRRAAKTVAPDARPSTPLKGVLVGFIGLGMIALVSPHSRLLDSYPYALGGLVGASSGYVLFRLVNHVDAAPIYALLFIGAPTGVSVSVLVNRYLDSSQPTDHTVNVLAFENRSRGEDLCLVESWRGSWSERIATSYSPCPVHGRIVVRTRAGVFGWPWIDAVWVKE